MPQAQAENPAEKLEKKLGLLPGAQAVGDIRQVLELVEEPGDAQPGRLPWGTASVVYRRRATARGAESGLEPGTVYAVKEVEKGAVHSQEHVRHLVLECSLCGYLKHPGIPALHKVLHTRDKVYLVFELCVGRTLLDVLQKERRLGSERTARIMRQVLRALHYLHTFAGGRVAHRNVKTDNILVSDTGQVWLINLGSAKVAPKEAKDEIVSTPAQSVEYCPLQTVHALIGADGRPPTTVDELCKSDVYAAGVVAFNCLTGTLPFRVTQLPGGRIPWRQLRPEQRAELQERVQASMQQGLRWPQHAVQLPKHTYCAVNFMLHQDAGTRPTAADALRLRWLAEVRGCTPAGWGVDSAPPPPVEVPASAQRLPAACPAARALEVSCPPPIPARPRKHATSASAQGAGPAPAAPAPAQAAPPAAARDSLSGESEEDEEGRSSDGSASGGEDHEGGEHALAEGDEAGEGGGGGRRRRGKRRGNRRRGGKGRNRGKKNRDGLGKLQEWPEDAGPPPGPNWAPFPGQAPPPPPQQQQQQQQQPPQEHPPHEQHPPHGYQHFPPMPWPPELPPAWSGPPPPNFPMPLYGWPGAPPAWTGAGLQWQPSGEPMPPLPYDGPWVWPPPFPYPQPDGGWPVHHGGMDDPLAQQQYGGGPPQHAPQQPVPEPPPPPAPAAAPAAAAGAQPLALEAPPPPAPAPAPAAGRIRAGRPPLPELPRADPGPAIPGVLSCPLPKDHGDEEWAHAAAAAAEKPGTPTAYYDAPFTPFAAYVEEEEDADPGPAAAGAALAIDTGWDVLQAAGAAAGGREDP